MEIHTTRLRLVAGTADLVESELEGAASLARLVDCATPEEWPPPLNDEESSRWFLLFVKNNPDAIGWGTWYFVSDRDLVGNGGFKGTPSGGTVEIGYSIVPRFHRRGFASEAVSALVSWAFAHDEVGRVIAHTFPDLKASIGVLLKTGFTFVGDGEEPATIRFELSRTAWEGRVSGQIAEEEHAGSQPER